MAESCDEQHIFIDVAKSFGVRVPPRFSDADDFCQLAVNRFITPFVSYVLEQLPEDEQKESIAGRHFLSPVAIQESLAVFHQDHPAAERTAFIMMQFAATSAHTGIEAAIKAALAKYNFTGLLARDKEYHEEMLPNIQTYMHGCRFGIAVFERIQEDNFNPNVSLEVGGVVAEGPNLEGPSHRLGRQALPAIRCLGPPEKSRKASPQQIEALDGGQRIHLSECRPRSCHLLGPSPPGPMLPLRLPETPPAILSGACSTLIPSHRSAKCAGMAKPHPPQKVRWSTPLPGSEIENEVSTSIIPEALVEPPSGQMN
jgi:hypothetical protein